MLGVGDLLELVGDLLDADGLELEDLRARLDGRRHFLELGRGHHEDDMGWRLFDRLEERVEGLLREPVDLVDDEDLVTITHRPDTEAGDDGVADLVDSGVGRRVDLEDVHVAALGNLDARVADAAGVRRRSRDAVQPARQDAGGRRLAHAAGPGEDERLRDAVARDGIAQRLRDATLPDDVIEPLRTPLSCENLEGGHWRMLNSEC